MKSNLTTSFSTRQYMRSKDFEIYYYNDNSMRHIENHSHNYYEFYFFINGEVSLYIKDEVYKLKPGDMVLIPPFIPHRADVLSDNVPYERFVFWISEEFCNELLEISPSYVYLMQHVQVTHKYVYHHDIIAFNTIRSKILSLIEELHFDRFGKNEKVSLCVRDLILHLNRVIYEIENPDVQKEDQKLYTNILSYIEEHIDEDLSLDTLSAKFFVNKFHIAHIFKDNLGLSVHQYILKKRLTMCKDTISLSTEVTEIYSLYGFKDYSSFYRAFKKEFGISPKEYKNLLKCCVPNNLA